VSSTISTWYPGIATDAEAVLLPAIALGQPDFPRIAHPVLGLPTSDSITGNLEQAFPPTATVSGSAALPGEKQSAKLAEIVLWRAACPADPLS